MDGAPICIRALNHQIYIFMQPKKFFCLLAITLTMCKQNVSQKTTQIATENKPVNTISYKRIAEIPTPDGFKRALQPTASFANWLQQLPLKTDKTVYLYNGTIKKNQSAQFAVIDVPVGDKDLQQCADAVMRLRASFLFDQQLYSSIEFYDNEQNKYTFSAPYTQAHFEKYLTNVFSYCGTASLTKQLQQKKIHLLQAGDVLIRGGFPGHAAIVVDVAENEKGQKIFMLAQSYMPAQSVHILINPINNQQQPWYELNEDDVIATPEYTFTKYELKQW
jgi:hypothetical protein